MDEHDDNQDGAHNRENNRENIENREAVRYLVLGSVQMVQIFEEVWAMYQELFERAKDMDDEALCGQVIDATVELEHNMTEVLDHVRGQLYLMTGFHEPLPTDEAEDFEASVLNTLAGLDDEGLDLDLYRVEDWGLEDE